MIKKYSYVEALELSRQYFNESDIDNALSAKVFIDKYALRNNDGDILEKTPDEMHDRLAAEFARIDSEKYGMNYDTRFKIYRSAIDKFSRIVPQGSPMAAIGNKYQLMSASNCVVVESPKDSMEGILDAGKDLAQLMKRRCGVGLDISTLRPTGAFVNNAARTTSGAWSFADFFSYVTRMVCQEGRRGALMITFDVHHPDIVQFATMKQDLTKVTGANISIRLSDEFLKAVEEDTEYQLRWPVEGTPKQTCMVRAKDVWKVIVESATKTAEPGLIMWDNMINNLPPHCYPSFKTISTNPCSEIALSAYDSCRLISMNLTGYVKNAFTKDAFFDFELFKQDIAIAQRMADNLVDLELELIEKIMKCCDAGHEAELWMKLWKAGNDGRRTGTGTHGLADTLVQLGLRYDGDDALNMVDSIYKALRDVAYETSVDLAKERGAFPVYSWELEKNCEFIKRLPEHIQEKMKKYGRRNIALLTQAPTGSVSLLSKIGEFNSFGVSSGVEPVFRNFYTRKKKINANDGMVRVDSIDNVGDKWQHFKIYHPNVRNYLESTLSLKDGYNDPVLPDYFVTSDQIDWMRRVQIQGVEQQYIDHSISSTINLPKGTSSEVVGNLYLESWKKGLKGVTVYVDGSRDGVLITESDEKPSSTNRPKKIMPVMAPKRPKELPCDIHHITVKGKKWIVLVGLLENDPYEVFMGHSESLSLPKKYNKGILHKTNKGIYNLHIDVDNEDLIIKDVIIAFDNPECAWATRMISTSLRHGVAVDFIVDQLSKDGGMQDVNKVLSRIFKNYIKDGQKVRTTFICPECKSDNLVYKDGCPSCLDCGHSKCV